MELPIIVASRFAFCAAYAYDQICINKYNLLYSLNSGEIYRIYCVCCA